MVVLKLSKPIKMLQLIILYNFKYLPCSTEVGMTDCPTLAEDRAFLPPASTADVLAADND